MAVKKNVLLDFSMGELSPLEWGCMVSARLCLVRDAASTGFVSLEAGSIDEMRERCLLRFEAICRPQWS